MAEITFTRALGVSTEDFSWHDRANCKGYPTAWWFPETGVQTDPRAKALCASCPVQQECLMFALRTSERIGVWGGKNSRQRRGLRAKFVYDGQKKSPKKES